MWTAEIANIWKNYVPPCRPSRYELDVCSRFLKEMRLLHGRQIRLLILGSTTEYRDWAFEEFCDVSIIDESINYHKAISHELTHKTAVEKLYIGKWQEMLFTNEFDMVVGDLVTGNLTPKDVGNLIKRVSNALLPNGLFLTKSFFYRDNYKPRTPDEILSDYEKCSRYEDPFPINAFELTLSCTDKSNYMLHFSSMFNAIRSAFERGIISEKTFSRYTQLGWENEMKFDFYVMPLTLWEKEIMTNFSIIERSIGPYKWSINMPYYVCKKTI
jgi:hypothetical protein